MRNPKSQRLLFLEWPGTRLRAAGINCHSSLSRGSWPFSTWPPPRGHGTLSITLSGLTGGLSSSEVPRSSSEILEILITSVKLTLVSQRPEAKGGLGWLSPSPHLPSPLASLTHFCIIQRWAFFSAPWKVLCKGHFQCPSSRSST